MNLSAAAAPRRRWAIRLFVAVLSASVLFGIGSAARAQADAENPWYRAGPEGQVEITLHFFWSETCPYCADAQRFLPALLRGRPWLVIESYEVSTSESNRALFADFAAALDEEILGVPAFFACGQMLVGFDSPEGTGALLAAFLDYCHELLADEVAAAPPSAAAPATEAPVQRPALPLLGELDTAQLSLPVLTLVLGGVDAFNPCAFFVLLFLLSLLVHTHSRARMLLIGGVFVVVSGLLYFVFMAAWLHLFLVLEGIRAVTLIAGIVAVALAVFTLKDGLQTEGRQIERRKAPGPSLSIPEGAKPGLFARMRALLSAESLPAMLTGTVVLAIAANTYELLCTSGLPMVYTRALTLSDLPTASYYLYLALYNVIYVLPLLAIVAVFAATLGSRKLSAAEGRALKLLSGAMMLGLGAILIVAPELLDNGLVALGLLFLAALATWLLHLFHRRRAPT